MITTEAISSILLRATLRAKPGHTLAVCDFSGIEARALAWVANDYDALEVFASGLSPYRVLAAAIFADAYENIPKTDPRYIIGKQAELMLGYGAGAAKFADTAFEALKAEGIEGGLDAVGVSAQQVVNAWRIKHAPSVRLWREIERACVGVLQRGAGAECEIAGGIFTAICADDGEAFALRLPSGRLIVYRNATLVPGKYGPQIRFVGGKGKPEWTYGGKLTENVIQAMCRDLLALALVRAEAAGLACVLHVHDELVCEVPLGVDGGATSASLLKRCMLELPEWAEGFPIGAAGHVGVRYRK